GDEIVNGVELVAVEERRILLRRQGVIEALPFATGELEVLGAGTVSAASEAAALQAVVENAGAPVVAIEALTASVAPSPTPDGASGVTLNPRGDGATFAAAGFASGDVVHRVNGRDVGNVEQLRTALSALGPGSTVEVALTRGGAGMEIEFELE
ncbi:MAG: PDZ domain-containing protein, partial [Maricaulaceae bacterium]